MYAGRKRSQREQRKNRDPGGVGAEKSLNTREQHQIHHDQ